MESNGAISWAVQDGYPLSWFMERSLQACLEEISKATFCVTGEDIRDEKRMGKSAPSHICSSGGAEKFQARNRIWGRATALLAIYDLLLNQDKQKMKSTYEGKE